MQKIHCRCASSILDVKNAQSASAILDVVSTVHEHVCALMHQPSALMYLRQGSNLHVQLHLACEIAQATAKEDRHFVTNHKNIGIIHAYTSCVLVFSYSR